MTETATASAPEASTEDQSGSSGLPGWGWALIGLGAFLIGLGIFCSGVAEGVPRAARRARRNRPPRGESAPR